LIYTLSLHDALPIFRSSAPILPASTTVVTPVLYPISSGFAQYGLYFGKACVCTSLQPGETNILSGTLIIFPLPLYAFVTVSISPSSITISLRFPSMNCTFLLICFLQLFSPHLFIYY